MFSLFRFTGFEGGVLMEGVRKEVNGLGGGVGFPRSGNEHGKVRAEGAHSLEMPRKAWLRSAIVSPRRRSSQQTISASDAGKEQLQESWGFWFARRGT